jgi:hypothetical protein
MPVNRATLGMCATFCYLTLADGLLPLFLMLDLNRAAHPFVWVTPMPTTTPPSLTTPTPSMPIPIRTHTIASDAQSPMLSLSTPSDEDGIQRGLCPHICPRPHLHMPLLIRYAIAPSLLALPMASDSTPLSWPTCVSLP